MNYDISPVVTITVTCYSGDHLFTCSAIYRRHNRLASYGYAKLGLKSGQHRT